MKSFFVFLLSIVFSLSSFIIVNDVNASTRTGGYFKKNGTYVAPYYRHDSDGYKFNNYSTKGNYNPYTGKKGYKSY